MLKKLKNISENLGNIKKLLKEKIKRQDILNFIDDNLNIKYEIYSITKDRIYLEYESSNSFLDCSFEITFIPNIEDYNEINISKKSESDEEETFNIMFEGNKTIIRHTKISALNKIVEYRLYEYLNDYLIAEKYRYIDNDICSKYIKDTEAYFDLHTNTLMKKTFRTVHYESDILGDEYETNYYCKLTDKIHINQTLNKNNQHSFVDISERFFKSIDSLIYKCFKNGVEDQKRKTLS